MALTYSERSALETDQLFREKIRGALADVAGDVMREDLSTANHAARVLLAQAFYYHPELTCLIFGTRMSGWDDITREATDAMIKTRLKSVWDEFVTADLASKINEVELGA